MNEQIIRLSALGRHVQPGDLYNYFTDEIVPWNGMVPVTCKQLDLHVPPKRKCSFFPQQSNKFRKHFMLGMNSHFYFSIERKLVDLNSLWFASYLQSSPPEDNVAEVTVFFRIVHQTESIDQQFINSNILDYKIQSGGRATHLVQEVDYGVELILLMRRTFDPLEKKKEDVETSIFTAAKLYFEQQINQQDWLEPPTELKSVYCKLTHSLEINQEKKGSFPQSIAWIRETIFHSEKWRPINIVLQFIPAQIETRLLIEKIDDIRITFIVDFELITNRSRELKNQSIIDRIPPLKRALCHFHDSLEPLRNVIEKSFVKFIDNLEQFLTRDLFIPKLTDMANWLNQRRKEIELLSFLLEGKQHLDMLDFKDIETQVLANKETDFIVFILKVAYHEDPLMMQIYQTIKAALPPPESKIPVFSIISTSRKRLETFSGELQAFAQEALSCSSPKRVYLIGLVPASSPYEDGAIVITGIKSFEQIMGDLGKDDGFQQNMLTSIIEPVELNYHVDSLEDENQLENPKRSDAPVAAIINPTEDKKKYDTMSQTSVGKKSVSSWEKRRIAEIYVGQDCQWSKIIKEGQPSIYLLNAMEKSIGPDFRWFVVGKSSAIPQPIDRKNHKVIILMGAVGSGKSTLIDGMFNYILGVQWQDPFRFKVIREVESGRDQTQTSSVTAYTIRHQDGMAVPYSITIIDTPGYGGENGSDKEITRSIRRFLSHPATGIDQIHAVCFVAALSDSPLTDAQLYIIDSALSIFGKNAKDNFRLLVTFADSADPPVVEACKTAHFPVTSKSTAKTYCKFNNIALYVSNQQQEDFSFDELFWEMGEENFYKFFAMLENMNSPDLVFTRDSQLAANSSIKSRLVTPTWNFQGMSQEIKKTDGPWSCGRGRGFLVTSADIDDVVVGQSSDVKVAFENNQSENPYDNETDE